MTTNPLRIYLSKALVILPFTFLFAPACAFLFSPIGAGGSQLLYLYLWYVFFIYLSAALALILEKYKYIIYLAIAGIAYAASYIINTLKLTKTIIYMDGEYAELIRGVALEPDEITYYRLILFITTAVICCFSTVYFKKSAFDFISRGNAFLFAHLAIIIGFITASTLTAVYLALFAASYFIARNFILINRELEIYGEKGAYNISGARRIYLYYFGLTLIFAVAPVIICFIAVPFIINNLVALAGAAASFIITQILNYERTPNNVEEVELPARADEFIDRPESLDELLVYYILLAVFILTVLIFIKPIIKKIKEIILFFRTKANMAEHDKNNIINQEIITELPKEKKIRNVYKNYLKNSQKIADISKRFLFAYNCLFWQLVKNKNLDLKESFTPQEVASIMNNFNDDYEELSSVTGAYEALKYGRIAQSDELLKDMTEKTEILLKQVLP